MTKKIIATALMGLLIVGMLAGCGAAKGPDVAVSAGSGNVALDPQYASSLEEKTYIAHLFEPLVAFVGTAGERVEPAAAESWKVETIEGEDGISREAYTFVLRPSGWSDKQNVVADNFLFAIERLLLSPNSWQLAPYIQGAEAFARGEADATGLGVMALDDRTLRISLERPCPNFLEIMASVNLAPLRRDLATANADFARTAEGFAGNGPYMLASWTPGDSLVMTKNKNYWNFRAVIPENITWKFTTIPETADALRAGEIAYAQNYLAEEYDALDREGLMHISPAYGAYGVVFQSNAAPFDDAKARQAFAAAVDQEALCVDALQNAVLPTATLNEGLSYQENSPSVSLTAGAGLSEAEYMYVDGSQTAAAAQALQAAWKEALGIEVTLVAKSAAEFAEAIAAGDFQMAGVPLNPLCQDPAAALVRFGSRYGKFFADDDFDAQLDAALAATGDARTTAAYEAEATLLSQYAVIPLWRNALPMLYGSSYLGTRHDPTGLPHIEAAYVPEAE